MVCGLVLGGLDAESLLGYRWYLSASELVNASERRGALADSIRKAFQAVFGSLDLDSDAI